MPERRSCRARSWITGGSRVSSCVCCTDDPTVEGNSILLCASSKLSRW